MFQRLKGAIDSRIAEEQARQRTSQDSPSRSNSRTHRSSSRIVTSNRRAIRTEERESKDGEPLTKGPDPSEFEPDFVIGSDNIPSRSTTPKPFQGKGENATADGSPAEATPGLNSKEVIEKDAEKMVIAASAELPTDVWAKLRKLERLELKYHELLRSYRIAHARVLSIEPFETSLRENTPLTSISDPGALVEYLNQVNLKGDMVLDELKRVSNERDSLKDRLQKAEQTAKEAWNEATNLRKGNELDGNGDKKGEGKIKLDVTENSATYDNGELELLGATEKSPTTSIKSRTASIPSLPIFSPKSKTAESPVIREGSEDLFSYENELPRMESELGERQEKIASLKHEVKTLKGDLAVARESTQSMVQNLEEATRELNALRESKERLQTEVEEQRVSSEQLLDQLKIKLRDTEENMAKLQEEHGSCNTNRVSELENHLGEANAEFENLQLQVQQSKDDAFQAEQLEFALQDMELKKASLEAERKQDEKRVETLNGLVKSLRIQVSELEEANGKAVAELEVVKTQRTSRVTQTDELPAQSTTDVLPTGTADVSTGSKKKNKKKKKIGKLEVEHAKESSSGVVQGSATEEPKEVERVTKSHDTVDRLQEELNQLRKLLEEKDAAIDRIHGKLKDQEELKEEIESLRDDIVNVGQEHVQAKDKVKELTTEKAALQTTVEGLEKELVHLRASQASVTAEAVEKNKNLTAQFEELKSKATTLQTDLAAAQQLASSRFKDLSDLKTVLQKAQPELTNLRSEVSELTLANETLIKRNADFSRLETRHEEMRSEIARLKQVISERDSDSKILNQKIVQEEGTRLKAEESSSKARQEVQRLEIEQRQATESLDRLSKDLARAREELKNIRLALKDAELKIAQLSGDNEGLKEDIELKTAQHASAESLMGSMRDQTAEMAMQMKEARERCENLEEEVADAHRLLSERSREGETMRKLLADVEGKADARVRDMKERMDTAIEERDRAEDEASAMGRRRARELEDLRNNVRDAERSLKRSEEDKEELEMAQRDWKRRREALELKTEQSTREADEVRKAMGEFRDALDESEKQARELEKQKFELRRSVEDAQNRLEKLQKSNKSMADEIRTIQTAKTKAGSEAQSSRSSIDSNLSRARLSSPAPKSRAGSGALIDSPNGQGAAPIDFVYLKNVLLQFLEQKDKKHQQQLVPVLGMLLHFDRKDEQKWMSAIISK